MTVNEAQSFFSGSLRLSERLHLLFSMGLGYLRLGQPATTLSGGEAQRLKIAAELAARGGTRDKEGGRIVAEGRPEDVAQSHTGCFLQPVLDL